MRCYTCGGEDIRAINTWTPSTDEPGEWVYVSVCADCDNGVGWEESELDNIYQMSRVAIGYGLPVDRLQWSPHYELGCVSGPEWSIDIDLVNDLPRFWVTMWTGSYPFAMDYPKGSFYTVSEAVRYVAWLLAREAHYQDILEKAWQAVEEESTP